VRAVDGHGGSVLRPSACLVVVMPGSVCGLVARRVPQTQSSAVFEPISRHYAVVASVGLDLVGFAALFPIGQAGTGNHLYEQIWFSDEARADNAQGLLCSSG